MGIRMLRLPEFNLFEQSPEIIICAITAITDILLNIQIISSDLTFPVFSLWQAVLNMTQVL